MRRTDITIDECLKALIRDRREPDKVLLNVASLKRALEDVRREFQVGDERQVWNMLYVDHTPYDER